MKTYTQDMHWFSTNYQEPKLCFYEGNSYIFPTLVDNYDNSLYHS